MRFGRLTIARVFGSSGSGTKVAVVVGAAALLAQLALVFSFIVPRLGTLRFLRLHYTSAFGVDWVGAWWNMFVFPAAGFAIFFANGAAASLASRRHPLLGSMLAFVTAFVELSLAAGGGLAVLLNS